MEINMNYKLYDQFIKEFKDEHSKKALIINWVIFEKIKEDLYIEWLEKKVVK